MAAKVYAVAYDMPASTPYFIAGKEYPVFDDHIGSFRVADEDGESLLCLWEGCAHLEGGDWTRVERQP